MRHTKWIISLVLLVGVLGLAAMASPTTVVRVKVQQANVREAADIKSSVIMIVKLGTVFEVVDKSGRWYKVTLPQPGTRSSGYIHESVVEEMVPAAEPEPEPTQAVEKEAPAQKEAAPPARKEEPKAAARSEQVKAPYKKIFVRLQYQMGFLEESRALSLTRTVYYENAQYGLDYSANKGNSIDAALGFRFARQFGVALGVSSTSRGMGEKTAVSIPHPLWMNSYRSGEVAASSLKATALDVYLNLVCFLDIWKFGIDIYGGPCYMLTKADVIEDISFNEGSYPYTEVTFTSSTARVKSNVIGFDVGASLGFELAANLAVFLDGRYVSGKGKYKSGTDIGDLSISLGGFKAGAGVKVMF
jgi:hypothetical protein